MNEQNKMWLCYKYIEEDCTDSQIQEILFKMTEETGFVTDLNQLKKDIEKKKKINSGVINKNLFITHTETPAVNHLCAAITVQKNFRVNAIIAYEKPDSFCLKRISAILEGLLNFTENEKNDKTDIDFLKKFSAPPVLSDIFPEDFISKKGFSFFD